ncbi:hypothetical protein HNR42_003139 [Deinobacterium chartae]|uniref:Uncharacterized protein n=1 Tax=Deinobacterium chartae TaxID=521158 RepID=A0A841I1J3_9DEIO|nr:hypothetical protein [Deinobacterium chartae]MBB6099681.1 hypothetical protein [Deinobacterium chartae]
MSHLHATLSCPSHTLALEPHEWLAAEESTVTLQASEPIVAVRWAGGPELPSDPCEPREPYAACTSDPRRWTLHLSDRVGALDLEVLTRNGHVHARRLYVYPSKLSSSPQRALEALRVMTTRLEGLLSDLRFPADRSSLPAPSAVRSVSADTLRRTAGELLQITRQVLSAPDSRVRATTAVRGNAAGRIDWSLSTRRWAQGNVLGLTHVVWETQTDWNTPGQRALLACWDALVAQLTAQPDAQDTLRRVRMLRAELAQRLPGVRAEPQTRAALSGRYAVLAALQERLAGSPAARNLPEGNARMSTLFELWATCEIAAALGCVGHVQLAHGQREFSGELIGPQYALAYNRAYRYRGVSAVPGHFGSRPDIYLHSTDPAECIRVVADVKYRNLTRLSPAALRNVHVQLRGYMGDYQAPLGLMVWPGHPSAPEFDVNELTARSRLGHLTLHPLEDPATLHQRIVRALSTAPCTFAPLPLEASA